MELLTAFAVISLNSILHFFCTSRSRIFARCQEIASPSRSGSVARRIFFASFASRRMVSRTSPLPRSVIYFGAKFLSGSTPSVDFGRSRTWPLDATTLYLLPKNFPMVFAFAGDSTITSVSAINRSPLCVFNSVVRQTSLWYAVRQSYTFSPVIAG